MKKANAKVLGIFLIAMGLAACDQQSSNPQPSSSSPVQATQPSVGGLGQDTDSADAIVTNTSCPVSGEKVDPQISQISYEGQAYGFCCDDCRDAFKANPAKYSVAQ